MHYGMGADGCPVRLITTQYCISACPWNRLQWFWWRFRVQPDLVYPNSLVPIKTLRIVKHADYWIFVNDRRGCQELCSDCETYGLKKHGLTYIGHVVYPNKYAHLSCDLIETLASLRPFNSCPLTVVDRNNVYGSLPHGPLVPFGWPWMC